MDADRVVAVTEETRWRIFLTLPLWGSVLLLAAGYFTGR
jgi:hypothetical protein